MALWVLLVLCEVWGVLGLKKCVEADLMSPLNLQLPLTYREFDFSFSTKRITNLQLVKLKPNVLRISGDWGSISYQGFEHRIYNLHIKSPSDHKINGISYPMEFQFSAVSIEGTEVLICILFERNDFNPMPILYNYGLGNTAIKQLTDADTNLTTATLALNTQLSIDDFIDTSKQNKNPFYIYEGSNPNSDCGLAINMVYAEPLWIGNEQLTVFDLTLTADYPAKDQYKSIIYQNIYNLSTPILHNATETPGKMQDSPVPGPMTHLPFLFMPEPGKPFGSINETFFAVWRGKPKDGVFIEPEIPPSRNGAYVFNKMGWRQFKLNGTDLTLYIAQYVMMSQGVEIPIPSTGIPISLPIYVRANYTYPNGMRPIVLIQMKINETERMSEDEKKSNLNMICKKWWMSVVLNRNFDHEARYQNVSESMLHEHINNKCSDYRMLSDEQLKGLNKGERKVDVEDPIRKGLANGAEAKKDPLEGKNLNDFGVRDLLNVLKNRQATRSGSGSGSGAMGNYCFTQLHIILNRRGDDNVGDYLHSGCIDPTQPIASGTSAQSKQVSLAQKGVQEVLRDRNAREFMNDQQLMNPLT